MGVCGIGSYGSACKENAPGCPSVRSEMLGASYYQVFKNTDGHDLQRILSSCLQFDTIGNASADMKEISGRAKEALKRIGQESLINARRVKRYGVEVDEKPA